MLHRSAPLAACAFFLLVAACSSANTSDDTDTSQASPGVTLSADATPQSEGNAPADVDDALGRWGRDAVWQNYFDADVGRRVHTECTPLPDVQCLVEIAEDVDVPKEATQFMRTHEAILIDFEEHGVTDFGWVTAPPVNMGRPMPVFLNGDFDLIYFGDLIPRDWHDHPDYEALPPMAIAWSEYAELVEASTAGDGQSFVLRLPVRECRACERLAFLVLDVRFHSTGGLESVGVLPIEYD